eukprot:658247-Prorocentrum_minimum.AAC.1
MSVKCEPTHSCLQLCPSPSGVGSVVGGGGVRPSSAGGAAGDRAGEKQSQSQSYSVTVTVTVTVAVTVTTVTDGVTVPPRLYHRDYVRRVSAFFMAAARLPRLTV